jgi:hypothetical protein
MFNSTHTHAVRDHKNIVLYLHASMSIKTYFWTLEGINFIIFICLLPLTLTSCHSFPQQYSYLPLYLALMSTFRSIFLPFAIPSQHQQLSTHLFLSYWWILIIFLVKYSLLLDEKWKAEKNCYYAQKRDEKLNKNSIMSWTSCNEKNNFWEQKKSLFFIAARKFIFLLLRKKSFLVTWKMSIRQLRLLWVVHRYRHSLFIFKNQFFLMFNSTWTQTNPLAEWVLFIFHEVNLINEIKKREEEALTTNATINY